MKSKEIVGLIILAVVVSGLTYAYMDHQEKIRQQEAYEAQLQEKLDQKREFDEEALYYEELEDTFSEVGIYSLNVGGEFVTCTVDLNYIVMSNDNISELSWYDCNDVYNLSYRTKKLDGSDRLVKYLRVSPKEKLRSFMIQELRDVVATTMYVHIDEEGMCIFYISGRYFNTENFNPKDFNAEDLYDEEYYPNQVLVVYWWSPEGNYPSQLKELGW